MGCGEEGKGGVSLTGGNAGTGGEGRSWDQGGASSARCHRSKGFVDSSPLSPNLQPGSPSRKSRGVKRRALEKPGKGRVQSSRLQGVTDSRASPSLLSHPSWGEELFFARFCQGLDATSFKQFFFFFLLSKHLCSGSCFLYTVFLPFKYLPSKKIK